VALGLALGVALRTGVALGVTVAVGLALGVAVKVGVGVALSTGLAVKLAVVAGAGVGAEAVRVARKSLTEDRTAPGRPKWNPAAGSMAGSKDRESRLRFRRRIGGP
jgi:hypothetical protein